MEDSKDEKPEILGADNGSDPELDETHKAKEAALKELLYLRADFDNYKKRILREQDQMVKFANEKFISDLLPVADLFDRALQHAEALKSRKEDKEAQNFVAGIEITQKELTNLLNRFGVEFIGAPGDKFDPARHEAISQREEKGKESGTVLDVLQRGCLLHGRLLTPARVVVAEKKS